MWVQCNPNPKRKHVPDCVIRALAIVLNETWYKIYDDLYIVGREEFTEADSKKLDVFTCILSRLMKSLPYIEEYGYDQDQSISGRRARDSMGRYASMAHGQPMSGYYMPPASPPVYGEGMGRNYYSSEYDPRYWR